MIAEEGPHHVALISFIAALHHVPQRAARETLFILGIERREGERGRAGEIAWHEKAARRQRGQRIEIGARLAQISLEQIGERLGESFVGAPRGIDLGERLAPSFDAFLRAGVRLCSRAVRDQSR